MSPIKKRRRYEEKEEAVKLNASERETAISIATIEQALDAVSAHQPPPKDALLELALLQNRLLHQIANQEAEMKQLRAMEGKKQKEHHAVAYEIQVLERQIADSMRHPIPYLTQLAREETGKKDDGVAVNDDPSTLREFLHVDFMDPKEKPKVLATLQTCFEQRAALGKTVQAKKQELQAVEVKLKKDQDFLKQLPTYLQNIERSSNSFAKFMEKHSMVHPLTGTSQRMKRLEHAKELPGPLYTLFSMIQRYIDSSPISSSNEQFGKLGLVSSNTQVTLQFPIPNVAAASPQKSRSVTLTFSYHEGTVDAAGAIEVRSHSDAFAIHDESLLAELFPGDTSSEGRYSWAQYLAGLHPAAGLTVQSTRWVLQQVRQRIRSNAILHHCLYSLERRHLPVLPNSNGEEQKPTTQLALFHRDTSSSDDTTASNGASLYNITIRHPTSGRELNGISVTLHRPRYPAVPPAWKIADTTFAELEERLQTVRKNDDDDNANESKTYDWMFVQQLYALLFAWDAMEETTGRTVRGRDRKAVH